MLYVKDSLLFKELEFSVYASIVCVNLRSGRFEFLAKVAMEIRGFYHLTLGVNILKLIGT